MIRNESRVLFGACLIIVCLGTPTYGQKFWEKKPYDRWSANDAQDMLVDSPWGQIQQQRYEPSRAINVRLHSALVIRQALVRVRQINRADDRLTPAEQANIDSKVKEFLECADCEKYYIVTLRPLFNDKTIFDALTDVSLADLKPYVSLTSDNGTRRDLVKFLPPTRATIGTFFDRNAMFFFSRLDEQGKPLINSENKEFYFTIDDRAFKEKSILLRKVTFKVSRILQNGQVLF